MLEKELKTRALREIKLAYDLFGFTKKGTKIIVPDTIDPKAIAIFCTTLEADIWSEVFRNTLETISIGDSNVFSCVYSGPKYADDVLNFVNRVSLYAEKIVMVEPVGLYKRENPIAPYYSPEKWIKPIINKVLALCYLEEWIRLGIITVVPQPWFWKTGMINEIESFGEAWLSKRGKGVFPDSMVSLMVSVISKEVPKSQKEKIWISKFAEGNKELELLLQKLVEKDRDINPKRYYYEPVLSKSSGVYSEMVEFDTGITFPEALFLGEYTNSYLSSTDEMSWARIKFFIEEMGGKIPDMGSLAISRSLQELNLNFLNDVTTDYVLQLRKDKKLETFRVFLKELWNKMATASSSKELLATIENYKDKIISELSQYNEEWNSIEKDVLKEFAKKGVVGTGSILLGVMDLKAALLGALGVLTTSYFRIRQKKGELKKNPLYVLLRLKNRKYS